MSNFTSGPLPCRNPENFSKCVIKLETTKKTTNTVVVHRNVEGENDGECYKIKGSKTPFLLKHLEKDYEEKSRAKAGKKSLSRPSSSAGTKRERASSDSENELEDANQPSTSAQSSRKRQRNQND